MSGNDATEDHHLHGLEGIRQLAAVEGGGDSCRRLALRRPRRSRCTHDHDDVGPAGEGFVAVEAKVEEAWRAAILSGWVAQ